MRNSYTIGMAVHRSIFMSAITENIREKVRHLADQLPPGATWDDVLYRAALCRSIERGLADAEAGRLIPVEELLREYGIEE
jgi:predicted transcriptional regulator